MAAIFCFANSSGETKGHVVSVAQTIRCRAVMNGLHLVEGQGE